MRVLDAPVQKVTIQSRTNRYSTDVSDPSRTKPHCPEVTFSPRGTLTLSAERQRHRPLPATILGRNLVDHLESGSLVLASCTQIVGIDAADHQFWPTQCPGSFDEACQNDPADSLRSILGMADHNRRSGFAAECSVADRSPAGLILELDNVDPAAGGHYRVHRLDHGGITRRDASTLGEVEHLGIPIPLRCCGDVFREFDGTQPDAIFGCR